MAEQNEIDLFKNIFDHNIISTLYKGADLNFREDFEMYYHMAKKDRIDFIYNTTALEGNPMTYPEVQTLLEGITVGGHKISDEQQILNQNKSVNYLLELLKTESFEVSLAAICELNYKVAFEESLKWGVFRDGQVNIGGTDFKPPRAENLEQIFNNGVKEILTVENPIIRAICYFLFGAISQFFWEGNKRTSRLVMNGILVSNCYPILNIKAKDSLEFNKKMLEFYDTQSLSKVLPYLVDYYKEQNKDYMG
ncbi:MAG: Fic family protein [Magnetococcales bacterium]|nr:Fic family protein [Magnetococcales bacterium]